MAIYHAHIKNFSRGKGESSMAAAAYRAGVDLVDTRTRELHLYSMRRGVASFRMLAPKGAPEWCLDIHRFWQANEASEARANARVGRELEVSLPNELSPEQREALALELGQMLVDRYGCAVLVALHAPSEKGDQRNFHTHLLMSARRVGPGGLGERAGAAFDARAGAGAEEVRRVRELVSAKINEHLAKAGRAETVDHRSLVDQSRAAAAAGDFKRAAELNRPPIQYRGKAITAMLRKGADPSSFRHPAVRGPEGAMAAAIEVARAAGTLASTPSSHGQAAALADFMRQAERQSRQGAHAAPKQAARPGAPRLLRGRAGLREVPSPTALYLARKVRLLRAEGNGAEVLNAEAEMIEAWIDNLNEMARIALKDLGAVPGVQIEPMLRQAVACASERRVEQHVASQGYFENAERLVAAILDFADASKAPFEARRRVDVARAELLGLEGVDSRDAAVRAARQELAKAKEGISGAARHGQRERIDLARAALELTALTVSRDYPVAPTERIRMREAWQSHVRGTNASTNLRSGLH